MGIVERLKLWAALRRVRPAEESAGVAGGREGELAFQARVAASLRFKGADVLSGRRIPSPKQGRRREIDLIVCTPAAVHLIEVKNWSGRIDVQGGRWRQTRRGDDVVDHGDLLATLREKETAVVEYLQSHGLARDASFARDHLASELVFVNANLELDPAVEARPDVVTRRELDGYLGADPKSAPAEGFLAGVARLFLDTRRGRAGTPQIPPGEYREIVARLTDAGTWDRIVFSGGLALTGDLIGFKLGPKIVRVESPDGTAARPPVRLHWTRGPFWGLFKALTGLGRLGSLKLGDTSAALTAADTVSFHAVGDRETRTHRLIEIEKIEVG